MVKAYILLKVEAGTDAKVSANLKKFSQIISASTTYGISDLIIEVDLPNIEDLDDFIFNKIRKISGVNETITVIKSKELL